MQINIERTTAGDGNTYTCCPLMNNVAVTFILHKKSDHVLKDIYAVFFHNNKENRAAFAQLSS